MTVVLKSMGAVGIMPLLTGVAVAETIRICLGVKAMLKWPNDIFVRSSKVGGVLIEAGWSGDELTYLLLGIGVNLNNPIPNGLEAATTLRGETGFEIDGDAFLKTLIDRITHLLDMLEDDSGLILEKWRRLANCLGENVVISDDSGEVFSGVAIDVDGEGALIVESGGFIKRVLSGDVNANVKFSRG